MLIRRPDTTGVGQTGTQASEDSLQEVLRSGTAEACIHSLAAWDSLPAAAREAALQRLQQDSDTRLQQVILNHLVPGMSEQEIEPLLSLLDSESAGLRNQVIDALGQMRETAILPTLQQAIRERLQHEDPDLRILTLNLVAALELPDLLPEVERILREEDDINVCMTALDTALVLGSDAQWPAIEALTARFPDEPFVAFSVRQARRQLVGDD